MNTKVKTTEDKLVDLMTQYLHAHGPRLFGNIIMKSLVQYSKEDGDDQNKLMLFSHVVFGMSGEVYDSNLTDKH